MFCLGVRNELIKIAGMNFTTHSGYLDIIFRNRLSLCAFSVSFL